MNELENINFKEEYIYARKLMGTKGVDLEKLQNGIAYLLIYCPEDLIDIYDALLTETEMRKGITD